MVVGRGGCGSRGCGLRIEGRGLWVEGIIKVTPIFIIYLLFIYSNIFIQGKNIISL